MGTPSLDDVQSAALVAAATVAKTKSYSPYSNFRVGAAVLADDGRVFAGCNVENASYGAGICAERSALVTAVTAGCRPGHVVAVAVAADCAEPISPCGVCRQFIREFGRDIVILLSRPDGSFLRHSLNELLPLSFGPESLPPSNQS